MLGIMAGPVGIPFGHVARAQIRRTGDAGDGLALAGLILGWATLILYAALFGTIFSLDS